FLPQSLSVAEARASMRFRATLDRRRKERYLWQCNKIHPNRYTCRACTEARSWFSRKVTNPDVVAVAGTIAPPGIPLPLIHSAETRLIRPCPTYRRRDPLTAQSRPPHWQ